MSNKGKMTTIILAVLILGVAGFLWRQNRAQNKKQETAPASNVAADQSLEDSIQVSDDEMSAEEEAAAEAELEDINLKCENGEWIGIGDVSGSTSSVSGKLRRVYKGDPASEKFANYSYFIEGPDSAAITGQNLAKLDYLEDREVEVQGVVSTGAVKEIRVSQVKCVGKETDKNVIGNREKLLSYIQNSINTIAPQKAKYKKWAVDTVEFVDENNVYVDYYDVAEDEDENFDEGIDTGRQVLLEATPKSGGDYDAKVLAYWEMGEDEYVLKSGADKFEDVEDTILYQYNPEENKWTRE